MSRIKVLMRELDLGEDIVEKTINKINEICQDFEKETGNFHFMGLNGNGDGDN